MHPGDQCCVEVALFVCFKATLTTSLELQARVAVGLFFRYSNPHVDVVEELGAHIYLNVSFFPIVLINLCEVVSIHLVPNDLNVQNVLVKGV